MVGDLKLRAMRAEAGLAAALGREDALKEKCNQLIGAIEYAIDALEHEGLGAAVADVRSLVEGIVDDGAEVAKEHIPLPEPGQDDITELLKELD